MLFRDEDEDLEVLPFADRSEAGCVLASKLLACAGRGDVIVLGLPRGGVPVALEVASTLHVPLDVLVVSKLRTPWNRELAMGAVAERGVQVLELSIVKALCVSEEDIQEVAAAARKELECREELYRSDRPPLELAGKTVIFLSSAIGSYRRRSRTRTATNSSRPCARMRSCLSPS